ncbi:MAG TPA: universal stress protein [Micromonosporaceae bacterium]|nr:universal stress protein [Micromonosporaceae bacterium]
MNTTRPRPVVAGFDGSPSSAAALEAAAAEAVSLGVPLRVVHAYAWPIVYATLANVPYQPGEWEPPESVRAELAATAERLLKRHPGLTVSTHVLAGAAGQVLVSASAEASLLVIGGRGVGGLAGLLARAVAPHVASRAQCPVLVVRADQSTASSTGAVVVGVDGSEGSRNAFELACRWALRRDAPLQAVHATGGTPDGNTVQPDPPWLTEWVSQARRRWPGLSVTARTVAGPAADVLVGESRSARLVVVGSRSRGELASLMLGSVGHDLIRRGQCPVVVSHGEVGTADPGRGEDSGRKSGTYGTYGDMAAAGPL